MPGGSTSSALELPVPLDRAAGQPLRSQLEQRLRDAIRSGRLPAGSQLPSTRTLARDLGVTRGLVVEAYAQLQAEGYLAARPGSGTIVAAPAAPGRPASPPRPQPDPALRWDFRPGVPDLRLFPRRDWAAALRRVLQSAPDTALGYGDPRGTPELRQALAGYLGRVRGTLTDPDRIVICAGYAQARNLLARVLRERGARRIGLEDPGQPESVASARRAGLTPVPIPVGEDGLHVGAVRQASPDAIVVTPAHQFPTGTVLAPGQRLALLDWARENGALIIEDDYDAEFRYDRDPVGALQQLAPDTVVYAGSASKSLAPGLRIGWLCCPPGLAAQITEAKRAEDLGAPVIEQLALAGLLNTGRFDRHLRQVRRRYRSRRDALAAALRQHAPHIQLAGISAGLHAVALLPPGADERAITSQARRRSVGLYPMSTYRYSHHSQPPALVLGYAASTEHAINSGIATIADLLGAE
jgi:GntR family transcriptional regulator/MocR family aminotransferase